jgi:hypothetical protein
MRSQAWCLAAATAVSLATLLGLPAHAGWGADLSRAVVTGLVRQYSNRLLQRGFNSNYRKPPANNYDKPGYGQSGYSHPSGDVNSNSNDDRPATHSANATHTSNATHHAPKVPSPSATATAHGSLRYPIDQKFIPPPPPNETVYPGEPDSSISSFDPKTIMQGSELVPPPPPAPSVWSDLEPVGHMTAKPVLAHQPPPAFTGRSALKAASSTSAPSPKKHFSAPADGTTSAASTNNETVMPKPAPDLHTRRYE